MTRKDALTFLEESRAFCEREGRSNTEAHLREIIAIIENISQVEWSRFAFRAEIVRNPPIGSRG